MQLLHLAGVVDRRLWAGVDLKGSFRKKCSRVIEMLRLPVPNSYPFSSFQEFSEASLKKETYFHAHMIREEARTQGINVGMRAFGTAACRLVTSSQYAFKGQREI